MKYKGKKYEYKNKSLSFQKVVDSCEVNTKQTFTFITK